MSTVEMVPLSSANGTTYDKAVKATEANGYRVAGQRRTFRKRLGRAMAYSAYMLSAAPIHLGLFIAVAVLIPSGGGLTLTGGVVVILLRIMVTRLGAAAQRRLNEKAIGTERPELIYAAPKSDGKVIRFLYPLRDPQSWLDVLWVLMSFPIAITSWCIAFIWVLMTPISLTQPLTLWTAEVSNVNHGCKGIGEVLNIPHSYLFDAGFGFYMGSLSLVFGPYLADAAGNVQFYVADVLLLRRARNRADTERLTRPREAGRRAGSAALRRLKRDLHDEPQQRLMRLNMDLARARRQAGSDPVRAQTILDGVTVQTQNTLTELRQLSRGIVPPVLVDRGLVAAVQEVAARSVVPVSVHTGIPVVPDYMTSAAYYVVAESLVNVNKYAGASSVVMTIDVSGGVLRLSVVDGGVGGADMPKRHGLMGLEERLRSVDGTLEIDSPAGGPITIETEIPCM